MFEEILYFIIGSFSSIIGAILGMGGGVIMKPILDAIGEYDVSTISVLSSSTVLAMALVSISKSMIDKTKIKGQMAIYLSLGSIAGGLMGKVAFDFFLRTLSCEWFLCIMQSVMLIGMLTTVIELFNHSERYHMERNFDFRQILGLGLLLGMISSFLGIGGGPLNVPILSIVFAMDAKMAAVHSIIIIFFSQIAALINVGFVSGFQSYDLDMLWVMIIGGVIGGFLGSYISKKISLKRFGLIFNVTVMLIIVLNMVNIFKFATKIH